MIDKNVAVITGASRGLGKSIAQAYARHGFAVGLNYFSSHNQTAALADELAAGGVPVQLLKADVRKSDEVDAMIKMVEAEWGRVDVWVNNAGISRDKLIMKMTDQEWQDVLTSNVTSAFYCIRAVSPMMKAAGQGAIVNMASYLAVKPSAGAANYAASKAALVSLTKSAALELGRHNIRVNAVMPGFHVTDMNTAVWKRYEEPIRRQHLLSTLPNKKDMGEFVYMVSTLDTVTGQLFPFESRLT